MRPQTYQTDVRGQVLGRWRILKRKAETYQGIDCSACSHEFTKGLTRLSQESSWSSANVFSETFLSENSRAVARRPSPNRLTSLACKFGPEPPSITIVTWLRSLNWGRCPKNLSHSISLTPKSWGGKEIWTEKINLVVGWASHFWCKVSETSGGWEQRCQRNWLFDEYCSSIRFRTRSPMHQHGLSIIPTQSGLVYVSQTHILPFEIWISKWL